ncbi:DUF6708 domain-containing protein [Cupriavidus agavae]|uniref:DUF6708 domain-containing protein n=1 Tax=Cupriavidus agavae TaxID=1001822 RepID=A0A4Q7RUP9_9BURK|nr:DUF6708 domain-containing protein [Cupriavidus agavae]RZT36757.1 hypothetical protein EV147_3421 [Cupriavidus agavae]
MYKGWTIPFKINRLLTQEERDQALPRDGAPVARPEQRTALIAMNSTYLDWIDRRFVYRGTMLTFVSTLAILFIVPFSIYANITVYQIRNEEEYWWLLLLMGLPVYIIYGLLVKLTLRGEYFSYTYWPIRFNRKTRTVHVFRHNGSGGTLSVPWDEIYFHIGVGGKQCPKATYICGHVLDGDIVKDTFALGHDTPKDEKRVLLEMWEFIRCYMEEGPEAAGPHPLDRYISLSVTPSLYNCHIMMHTYYVGGFPLIARILAYPFVLLYTATRWLVLHTCRRPVFPPDVEAACQVESDDPNVWPVPRRCAEFADSVPGLWEHAMDKERARRREQRPFGK